MSAVADRVAAYFDGWCWVDIVEWVFMVVAIPELLFRAARNLWRMPSNLRELARLLNGKVKYPWAGYPHIEGMYLSRLALIELREVWEAGFETNRVWVRLALAAPELSALESPELAALAQPWARDHSRVACAIRELSEEHEWQGFSTHNGWFATKFERVWDVNQLGAKDLVGLLDDLAIVVEHLCAALSADESKTPGTACVGRA